MKSLDSSNYTNTFREIRGRSDVILALKKLRGYIETEGICSYDPYDVLGQSNVARMLAIPLLRNFVSLPCLLFPKTVRHLLRIPKSHNPMTVALCARAYSTLDEAPNSDFRPEWETLLLWLCKNVTKTAHGVGWGYPFDWQSKLFIPSGKPLGVVSAIAAHAFIDSYMKTRNNSYLETAKKTVGFFIHDLGYHLSSSGSLCFNYSPGDGMAANNANCWVASVLARMYLITRSQQLRDLCIKALQFTFEEQRPDGGLFYYAKPSRRNKDEFIIDNFHTGFVVESLLDIYHFLCLAKEDAEWIKPHLFSLYSFYLRRFFPNCRVVTQLPKSRLVVIEGHDLSQGIIVFAKMAELDERNLVRAYALARWAIETFQSRQGFFYSKRYLWGVDKNFYARWPNASMFYALSLLHSKMQATIDRFEENEYNA